MSVKSSFCLLKESGGSRRAVPGSNSKLEAIRYNCKGSSSVKYELTA